MDVTEVTSEPLAQVQNVLFGQLLQDWQTGRRLWALGYDVSVCANEAQMNGWADAAWADAAWADAAWADDAWADAASEASTEPSIEDDYEFIRRGC